MLDNIVNPVVKKILKRLSIKPFFLSFAIFAMFVPFIGLDKALGGAFFIFAFAGLAEYVRAEKKDESLKKCESFESLKTMDSELFVKMSDEIFGVGKWKTKTEDVHVEGLVFGHITTVSSSSFQTIDGPLCPRCKKSLSFEFGFFFPKGPGYKYTCLCGYKKILKDDPETIYKRIRRHFKVTG